jgi:acyl-CoA synthetase (AMP-forming)/AMP-acid ligase II
MKAELALGWNDPRQSPHPWPLDRQRLLQGRRRPCVGRGRLLPHGDVATIDPDGYLQLVDRAKDIIKSGGEWIPID